MSSEELSKCYNRALFLLGRRAYSSHKLREKLKKDFTPESIEQCIQQLVQKKYIDDDAYLEHKWLRGKHAGQGSHYLTRKFKYEGFNSEKINTLNQDTTDEKSDLDLVISYLRSKKKNLLLNLDSPELKTKEKIYRHLLYKGHSYSFVDKIWKKLTSELID